MGFELANNGHSIQFYVIQQSLPSWSIRKSDTLPYPGPAGDLYRDSIPGLLLAELAPLDTHDRSEIPSQLKQTKFEEHSVH